MHWLKIALFSTTLLVAPYTLANSPYRELYPEINDIDVDKNRKSLPKTPKGTDFVNIYPYGIPHHPTSIYKFGKEKLYVIKDKKSEKEGVIDDKGKIIIPVKYYGVNPLTYDLFAVSLSLDHEKNDVGIINRKLETVIPFKYFTIEDINLKDNLIVASKRISEDRRYGFINLQNQVVIPFKFGAVTPFSEGLAVFTDCRDTEADECPAGFIDKAGKIVVPAIYPTDLSDPEGVYTPSELLAGNFSFANGFVAIKNDLGKYGYIDKTGQLTIPYQFDDAYAFGETIECHNDNGKLYKKVQLPSNQARVYKNEKDYLIDNTGKILKTIKFDKSHCLIL